MRKAAALCIFLLCLAAPGCTRDEVSTSSQDLFAMDTFMDMTVTCADPEAALSQAADRIGALEAAFSVTDPDSDISRINDNAGTAVTVGEDTAAVIAAALQYGQESGGALDITVNPVLREWGFTTGTYKVPEPERISQLLENVDYRRISLSGDTVQIPEQMRMDLGALAKGYTGDRILEIFRSHGAQSALVNLGGNVQTLGTKPDGSLWTVGICDPFDPAATLGFVRVQDCAVITSGNYERYFEEDGQRYWHILDPADGCPADNGFVSVTIIGESGLMCDALSTALFVEGPEQGCEHWRSRDDFEMIGVTDDGRILVTEGAADIFVNESTMPVEVVYREDS